jgi:nitrite reductase (cytochrome c-552)
VRLVEVTEETTDPAPWGMNWSREYDAYKRTSEATRTKFGGSEALPEEKIERDPWLKRMFAATPSRSITATAAARLHAVGPGDDEARDGAPPARRVPALSQRGHPHVPQARGRGRLQGLRGAGQLSYQDARAEIVRQAARTPSPAAPRPASARRRGPSSGLRRLPRSQVDGAARHAARDSSAASRCSPRASAGPPPRERPDLARRRARAALRSQRRRVPAGDARLRVRAVPRRVLLRSEGDALLSLVQRSARRADRETYDDHKFPDGHRFYDWKHAETGAEVLKAQHPEFEMWSQGIHARSGVTCADCHMPYKREGAMKVSDHWVRSPLRTSPAPVRSAIPTRNRRSSRASRRSRRDTRPARALGHGA